MSGSQVNENDYAKFRVVLWALIATSIGALLLSIGMQGPEIRPLTRGLLGGFACGLVFMLSLNFKNPIVRLGLGISIQTAITQVFFHAAKAGQPHPEVTLYVQFLGTFMVLYLSSIIVATYFRH